MTVPIDRIPTRMLLLSTVVLGALALLFVLPGCAVSTPFRGPGFDAAAGVRDAEPEDSVVVALTHAVLDPTQRAPFDAHVDRIRAVLPDVPGYIGGSFRVQLFGNEAWTMTVWSDEDAMYEFVDGSVHARAVDEGTPALVQSRVHHLEVPAGSIPLSWSRAFEILDAAQPLPGPAPTPR